MIGAHYTRRQFIGLAASLGASVLTEGILACPALSQEESAAVLEGAGPFPSWNPECPALCALCDYVDLVINPASPSYVDQAERVAVFDMDGTLLCERDPIYFDWSLECHRVFDDPTYEAPPEIRGLYEQIMPYMDRGEVPDHLNQAKIEALAQMFAGMTPGQFESYVLSYASTTAARGFEGMTYLDSFYLPMVEVVEYLRANGFRVFIITACDRYVVRAFAKARLGIPASDVTGTDRPLRALNQGDVAGLDYTIQPGEDVVFTGEPGVENGKSNKVFSIFEEVGTWPLLAFGNSSSDFAMATLAASNPNHPGMAFMVLCDDTEREYGQPEKAAKVLGECEAQGWQAISMRDDWATIYGPGVKKTAL